MDVLSVGLGLVLSSSQETPSLVEVAEALFELGVEDPRRGEPHEALFGADEPTRNTPIEPMWVISHDPPRAIDLYGLELEPTWIGDPIPLEEALANASAFRVVDSMLTESLADVYRALYGMEPRSPGRAVVPDFDDLARAYGERAARAATIGQFEQALTIAERLRVVYAEHTKDYAQHVDWTPLDRWIEQTAARARFSDVPVDDPTWAAQASTIELVAHLDSATDTPREWDYDIFGGAIAVELRRRGVEAAPELLRAAQTDDRYLRSANPYNLLAWRRSSRSFVRQRARDLLQHAFGLPQLPSLDDRNAEAAAERRLVEEMVEVSQNEGREAALVLLLEEAENLDVAHGATQALMRPVEPGWPKRWDDRRWVDLMRPEDRERVSTALQDRIDYSLRPPVAGHGSMHFGAPKMVLDHASLLRRFDPEAARVALLRLLDRMEREGPTPRDGTPDHERLTVGIASEMIALGDEEGAWRAAALADAVWRPYFEEGGEHPVLAALVRRSLADVPQVEMTKADLAVWRSGVVAGKWSLRLEPVREAALASLRNTDPAAILVGEELVMTTGGLAPPTRPLHHAKGGEPILRVCDRIAHRLAGPLDVEFSVFWPEQRRDATISEMQEALESMPTVDASLESLDPWLERLERIRRAH